MSKTDKKRKANNEKNACPSKQKTRIAELKIEFDPRWTKLYNKIFGASK